MGTKIEKLNDSNYHAWKQKVLLLLALKDLDQYIDQNFLESNVESAEKRARGDRKAQAVIGLSLMCVVQKLPKRCGRPSRMFSSAILS